ncbi:MAG: chemotaxis protein CheW [Lachnospiraceae bacterium]|nr:chemotaxis protein CheW [Lachnospiraceae bacterium]
MAVVKQVEPTSKQYIVVKIDNEQFGIDIKYIDNIVRLLSITRVPMSQDYFKGVINLRGEIIPVMSLRKKLGLADDQFSPKTRIIISKVENATVGIIVDEVKEVITLEDDGLESVNYDNNDYYKAYISAVGKEGNELISILDIYGVIVEDENQ